jgi:HD-GYP domain-containing protein (c-di-GMP phosphodiesterase class II)
MTSDRVYRKGIPLYEVLKQMKEDTFGKLETFYVYTFIQKLMEWSVGNKAILSDGLVVEVVFVHPDEPLNPLVRHNEKLMDLRKSELFIKELLPVEYEMTIDAFQ